MSASPHLAVPIPPASLRLDSTLGALLIGVICTAILFGVTTIQIYTYYGKCQRDGSIMKWTVLLLWFLDVLCMVFSSHTIYYYAVTKFMDPTELLYCSWSLAGDVIIGISCQVIVTSIYAHRIWKLSGKAWTLLLILPLSLCVFAGAIAISVLVRKFPLFTDFKARFSWLWTSTLVGWALCDCIIAASLCTILIRQRTGFRKTDSLIKTFMMYSVSTGLLTSSVSVAAVITFATMADNFVFVALAMILPKLMLNSLLVLLNSRDSMREKISGPISIHLSKLRTQAEASSENTHGRGANWVDDKGVKPSQSDEGTSTDGQYSQV